MQFESISVIILGAGGIALGGVGAGAALAMTKGGIEISLKMRQAAALVAVHIALLAFGVWAIVAGYLDYQKRTTYAQISECKMLKNQALDRIEELKASRSSWW